MIPVDDLLDALSGTRLCVVGDLLLDCFISGRADRISPEAPVPVVVAESQLYRASGVATAAQPLLSLGTAVEVVTAVGDDAEGERVVGLLTAEGTNVASVTVPGRPTPLKTRIMAAGQHLLRIDRETTADLPPQDAAKIINLTVAAMARADAVLISDYAKGVCTRDVVETVIERARAAGIPVVVDPKRSSPHYYAGTTAITPNEQEFARFAAHISVSDQPPDKVAVKLCELAGFDWVVTTRSADGLTVTARDGDRWAVPAYAREVADVGGAGDAVAATISACLGAKRELTEASQLASLIAGLSLRRLEHKRIRPDEVRLAAARFGLARPIVDPTSLVADISRDEHGELRQDGP